LEERQEDESALSEGIQEAQNSLITTDISRKEENNKEGNDNIIQKPSEGR
jgi:hypothetical protein